MAATRRMASAWAGVQRVSGGALRAAMRRIMLDRGGGLARSVLVAGTGRSGTTWVGDVVAAALDCRVLFEPFLVNRQGRFVFEGKGTLHRPDVAWNQPVYLPPSATPDPRHHAAIAEILEGRVRDKWIDVQPRVGIHERRVIKEIRANLMLGYISLHWPELRILCVVRDPVHVVDSMISRAHVGWDFDFDPSDVLSDEKLMQDHLLPFEDLIRSADDLPSRLTVRWCVENHVARRQMRDAKAVLWLDYEALNRDRELWGEVADFLADIGWSSERARRQVARRSRTSRSTTSEVESGGSEPSHLSTADVDRIHEFVRAFGLSDPGGK